MTSLMPYSRPALAKIQPQRAASSPDSFLGKMTFAARWGWIFAKAGREYGIKLVIAILLTPAVYAMHTFVVRVLRIEPETHEA